MLEYILLTAMLVIMTIFIRGCFVYAYICRRWRYWDGMLRLAQISDGASGRNSKWREEELRKVKNRDSVIRYIFTKIDETEYLSCLDMFEVEPIPGQGTK